MVVRPWRRRYGPPLRQGSPPFTIRLCGQHLHPGGPKCRADGKVPVGEHPGDNEPTTRAQNPCKLRCQVRDNFRCQVGQ